MKLDLEREINHELLNNNELRELTKQLEETLKEDDVLVYQGYDYGKFTNENEEKLWQKERELIEKYIGNNKLYRVSVVVAEGRSVFEYDGTYNNKKFLTASKTELLENVKEGMFFRKVDGNYIFDKVTTENIYNDMKIFEEELLNKQNEVLKSMRKEGAIYKVTHMDDDCAEWRTELTNQETGECFQELEFPHDVYHKVGVNSLVKYENETYKVLDGTSIYDLYPNVIENYCEKEGVYVTKNAKYETSKELYDSIEKEKRRNLLNNILNTIKTKLEKMIEFISLKWNKFYNK